MNDDYVNSSGGYRFKSCGIRLRTAVLFVKSLRTLLLLDSSLFNSGKTRNRKNSIKKKSIPYLHPTTYSLNQISTNQGTTQYFACSCVFKFKSKPLLNSPQKNVRNLNSALDSFETWSIDMTSTDLVASKFIVCNTDDIIFYMTDVLIDRVIYNDRVTGETETEVNRVKSSMFFRLELDIVFTFSCFVLHRQCLQLGNNY